MTLTKNLKTSEVYKKLYHYTNHKGLVGILESQSLWATHYKDLNDKTEIIRFAEHLQRILYPKLLETSKSIFDNKEKKKLEKSSSRKFATLIEEEVSKIVNIIYKVIGDGFFISSFCSHNDEYEKKHGLLSQWRGYGQDGYALIFHTKKLETLLESEHKKFQNYQICLLADAVYENDKNKYDEEFSESEEHIIKYLVDLFKDMINGTNKSNAEKAYEPLIQCISRIKHQAFREEKEVRIVAFTIRKKTYNETIENDKPYKIVQKTNNGTSYLELFDFAPNLPIEQIIVGPGEEQEKKFNDLKKFLEEKKLYIKITKSETPFLPNKT